MTALRSISWEIDSVDNLDHRKRGQLKCCENGCKLDDFFSDTKTKATVAMREVVLTCAVGDEQKDVQLVGGHAYDGKPNLDQVYGKHRAPTANPGEQAA